MKQLLAIGALFLILASCTPIGGEGSIPDPYLLREGYCRSDDDCVRQKNCCDCGDGIWVNKQHYNESACGPNDYYCKCATRERIAVCENERCTSRAA